WQDKPINLTVASHPICWAKTVQSYPRLLQNFAPRKSAMYGYFTTYCSEEALLRRENEALARLKREGRSGEDLENRLQFFRHYIRDHPRRFEEFKERFFCDLYPENATRFEVTFEDYLIDPCTT